MKKTSLIIFLLAAAVSLLAGCGARQRPEIGAPGQVSLVFFYTEA